MPEVVTELWFNTALMLQNWNRFRVELRFQEGIGIDSKKLDSPKPSMQAYLQYIFAGVPVICSNDHGEEHKQSHAMEPDYSLLQAPSSLVPLLSCCVII